MSSVLLQNYTKPCLSTDGIRSLRPQSQRRPPGSKPFRNEGIQLLVLDAARASAAAPASPPLLLLLPLLLASPLPLLLAASPVPPAGRSAPLPSADAGWGLLLGPAPASSLEPAAAAAAPVAAASTAEGAARCPPSSRASRCTRASSSFASLSALGFDETHAGCMRRREAARGGMRAHGCGEPGRRGASAHAHAHALLTERPQRLAGGSQQQLLRRLAATPPQQQFEHGRPQHFTRPGGKTIWPALCSGRWVV